MKWRRMGLVYGPDGSAAWARHSALQPTPIVMGDFIRIYVGFRDDHGVSRPGFVDVDAANPSRVLDVSRQPVLEVGGAGTFDENGVVPCAVLRRDDRVYMYYAGYQLGHKVRFVAYGGLAVSETDGRSFVRHSRVPITDRVDEAPLFRVIHSLIYEGSRWRAWYGGGDHFVAHMGRMLPVYDIRYMESADGISFPREGRTVVALGAGGEHRVGRPYVVREDGMYRMFYAAATMEQAYRLGYAESPDGIAWTRKDGELGLALSASGWDSRMMAYPSYVRCGDRRYLFYNGNDYGREGFGYAVLEGW